MNNIFIDHNDKKSLELSQINDFISSDGIEVNFIFRSDFKNAKILRDYVEYILKTFDVASRDISRFILAADEMNNNAIEHGSNIGDENNLRLIVKKDENKVHINMEVQDSGKGPKSKTAQEMQKFRETKCQIDYKKHTSIRGRGLFLIIINIVDELYFLDAQTGGLIVGIKKDLPYGG